MLKSNFAVSRFTLFLWAFRATFALLMIAVITGCAVVPPIMVAQSAVKATQLIAMPSIQTSETTAAASSETTSNHNIPPWEDPANPLHQRIIYFDTDSIEVKPEYLATISLHAHYLGNHPTQRITLEGYTDMQGTRHYNLALADQRTNAVRQLMLAEGVLPAQMTTLSYGEERSISAAFRAAAEHTNHCVIINY